MGERAGLQDKTWQRLAASGGKLAGRPIRVRSTHFAPADAQHRSAVFRPDHRIILAVPRFFGRISLRPPHG